MGAYCLLMGLEIDPQRQAVLTQYAASVGIWEGEAGAVFRHMAEDEELSKQVRIYGTVTPADILSAWHAVYALRQRQQDINNLSRRSGVTDEERRKPFVQVEPPSLRGKADNLRRLKEGTSYPEAGTQAYNDVWHDYYKRDYVTDAREKARKCLKDYSDWEAGGEVDG